MEASFVMRRGPTQDGRLICFSLHCCFFLPAPAPAPPPAPSPPPFAVRTGTPAALPGVVDTSPFPDDVKPLESLSPSSYVVVLDHLECHAETHEPPVLVHDPPGVLPNCLLLVLIETTEDIGCLF